MPLGPSGPHATPHSAAAQIARRARWPTLCQHPTATMLAFPTVRVAVVVERFARHGGGVEGAAYQLARELGRRGLDVTAVCRTAEDEVPEGVHVRTVRVPRAWSAT